MHNKSNNILYMGCFFSGKLTFFITKSTNNAVYIIWLIHISEREQNIIFQNFTKCNKIQL